MAAGQRSFAMPIWTAWCVNRSILLCVLSHAEKKRGAESQGDRREVRGVDKRTVCARSDKSERSRETECQRECHPDNLPLPTPSPLPTYTRYPYKHRLTRIPHLASTSDTSNQCQLPARSSLFFSPPLPFCHPEKRTETLPHSPYLSFVCTLVGKVGNKPGSFSISNVNKEGACAPFVAAHWCIRYSARVEYTFGARMLRVVVELRHQEEETRHTHVRE